MRLISKLLAVLALAATSATQGGDTATRELVLENQGQTAGRLSADTPSSLAGAAPKGTCYFGRAARSGAFGLATRLRAPWIGFRATGSCSTCRRPASPFM
jgi:hypothetical protein